MKRYVILLVLAMVVAACGGDGGSDGGADDNGSDGGDDTPAATQAPSGDDDGQDVVDTVQDAIDDADIPTEGEGAGTATVTVDGETYYFADAGSPAIQCLPDFFGVQMGALQRVDADGNAIANGGSLSFALLRPGTDPDVVDITNEFVVKIEDADGEFEWTADEGRYEDRELVDGTSEVTSVNFDGNTATGTASAYDDEAYWGHVGDPDSVPTATIEFELTCFDE